MMTIKFRPGVVLADETGRALRLCYACREPMRMHQLGYIVQRENKERIYRLCMTLQCPACQRETVLPLKTCFADARQAAEAIRRALGDDTPRD